MLNPENVPPITPGESNPSFAATHLDNAMKQFGDRVPEVNSGQPDMEYKTSVSPDANNQAMGELFKGKEAFADLNILDVVGAIKNEGDRFTSAAETLTGIMGSESGRRALNTLLDFWRGYDETNGQVKPTGLDQYRLKQSVSGSEPGNQYNIPSLKTLDTNPLLTPQDTTPKPDA